VAGKVLGEPGPEPHVPALWCLGLQAGEMLDRSQWFQVRPVEQELAGQRRAIEGTASFARILAVLTGTR